PDRPPGTHARGGRGRGGEVVHPRSLRPHREQDPPRPRGVSGTARNGTRRSRRRGRVTAPPGAPGTPGAPHITTKGNRGPQMTSTLLGLRVENYKRLGIVDIEFPPEGGVIAVMGENEAGKTSLL